MPEMHYINLGRARQRRASMEVQARAHGLALTRFAACEAAAIDEDRFAWLSTRWERPMTRPELAAYLSHRALWERAAATPEGLVILEDDTIFAAHFRAVACEVAASGYDLVNFETVGRRKFFKKAAASDRGRFRFTALVRDKSGAGAYYVSQAGARRLLAASKTHVAPVDAYMFGVCRLKIAQVEPAATMQVHLLQERGFDVGLTTTTSIHQPRQRLPLTLTNLGYVAKRLRTQLRLAGVQARRLVDVEFRRADFDHTVFDDVLPIPAADLDAEMRRYWPADQTPS
ncbi:glycosyltransferase family 25 protein [Jiella flava]|uniref:Glycosyltransferase family 25 protein n=2 Tax=Jiella flava TaxID=2816857 RepID=A0A939JTY9_9HYPH|nr:glycosyltransferase family 25 protein [Jiella flava]MBO0662630.1 glycosyltransferase family 25 protein [Jiella flava]